MASFEEVLELFIEECRAGKSPSVSDYRRQYSEYADSIAELFPALLLLEKKGSSAAAPAERTSPRPERIDQYRIDRLIGRGGMGIVYEAYDEALHRTVALKVLRHFRGEESQAIRRFRREALTAAGLHHTNIVPVFGTGYSAGEFYYVMQAIPGIGIDRFLDLFRPKKPAADERRDNSDDLIAHIAATADARFGGEITPAGVEHIGVSENYTGSMADPLAETDVADARKGCGFESGEAATELPAATEPLIKANPEAATAIFADRPVRVEQPATDVWGNVDEGENADSDDAPTSDDLARERNIVRRFLDGAYGDTVQYRSTDAKGPPLSFEMNRLSFDAFEGGGLSFSRWCRSVCGVGIQIAQALHYAHRNNVLHRDIKPSNLLLDEGGVVWITDFGLARPATQSDLTRSGQIVGTLRYMAPETLSGVFSPVSDLYSLGLTLYEMLTFVPAYRGSNYTMLLGQIGKGELTRPRKINRNIPRDLETILLKATEKAPDKRYQSASEMADDLRRFLDERPIRARRISFLGRFWRWCRRNRLLAASVVTSAILLAALAVAMTVGFLQERSLRLDRELASSRATENLNAALSAFDDIFSTFGEPTRSWNFAGGTGDFFLPLSGPPVSDTDLRVLEKLLAFYDRFSAQNADNEDLLLETARAYANIGRIRQRVGRSDEALPAYKQSIEYYRKSFAVTTDPAGLELEEAQIVCRFLPLLFDEDDTKFFNILNLAVAALESYSDLPRDRELRGRILAKLLCFRALIDITASRREGDRSLASFLFFNEGERPTVDARDVGRIGADIQRARTLLTELIQGRPEDALLAAERNLVGGIDAIELALCDQTAESRARQKEITELAERLAAENPDSEMFRFHKIEINLLAVCALRINSDPSDRIEQRTILEKTLPAAEKMHEDYPDAPGYLAYVIIVRHALGRVALLLGDEEKADRYFALANDGMDEFRSDFPHFRDFHRFEPLVFDAIARLIEFRHFDEAQKRIDRVRQLLSNDPKIEKRLDDLTRKMEKEKKRTPPSQAK